MRVVGKIGLTNEQRAARALGIGGSEAPIIASGDVARIERLRLEKVGRIEPENLDWVIPVQFGHLTEPFNLDLLERETHRTITREGESVVSAEYDWRRGTLDGFMADNPQAIVQAKCRNAFWKPDELQKDMAQLHHEMDVCGVEHAYIGVFIGTMNWDCWLVERDADYAARLLELETLFWECVQQDRPWPGAEPPAPPPAPGKLREVDMSTSNAWGAYAADWLDNRDAAKSFEKAATELKALVDPDVGRAFGAGLEINRDKRGALRIKEMKE